MTKNKKAVFTIIAIYTALSIFIAFQFGVFSKAFLIGTFDSRLIVWQQSFDIIKENFWFGKGVGNSVSALEGKFLLINYLDGIEQKYNAQNQFIESFLETGVFGFILVSAFFAYAFIKAFIEKNTLYFVYTCIILTYMMTESLFQTQMGMVSFAFFNALFLAAFYNQDKKDVI
jgi:O-antigen ligase